MGISLQYAKLRQLLINLSNAHIRLPLGCLIDLLNTSDSTYRLFKQALFSFLNVSSYNILHNFAIDRVNAISYTHLHLYAYPLTIIFFKIGCRESPACFIFFSLTTAPLYSALRTKLLSSAARIFADRWITMSVSQIASAFLFDTPFLLLEQSFISEFYLLASLFT